MIRVVLKLDEYQLVNVLRAIRTAPCDGDWYGEVLSQIDDDMRQQNFCLPETRSQSPERKPQYHGFHSDLWLSKTTTQPNTPYPEDFFLKWGINQGKKLNECEP